MARSLQHREGSQSKWSGEVARQEDNEVICLGCRTGDKRSISDKTGVSRVQARGPACAAVRVCSCTCVCTLLRVIGAHVYLCLGYEGKVLPVGFSGEIPIGIAGVWASPTPTLSPLSPRAASGSVMSDSCRLTGSTQEAQEPLILHAPGEGPNTTRPLAMFAVPPPP